MAADDGTPPAQDPPHGRVAAPGAGDDVALAESVASAGLNAFGCVFVELWVIAEDGTALFRPEGGQWMVRAPPGRDGLPRASRLRCRAPSWFSGARVCSREDAGMRMPRRARRGMASCISAARRLRHWATG